jgi:hypothetical protein
LKLLTEYINFDYSANDSSVILEAKEEDGKLLLSGPLQKANTLNQNGRIYPFEVLKREVGNYQKFIKEGRALGELDHPDSSVVSLANVSHCIRKAYMEGDTVYGTIEVLSTPKGMILKSLIDSGIKIGISSRGVGSTRRRGDHQEVQDDFQLICWDIVSEPSTPGAFVMKEARDLTRAEITELNNYFSKDDKVHRELNNILRWGE